MDEHIECNGPGEACYGCQYAEEVIERWSQYRINIWCHIKNRDITDEIHSDSTRDFNASP